MSRFRRKKDSFYVILKRTYSFGRDSNPDPRVAKRRSTTELPDLLMSGHKNSVYQAQNKLLQINQVYAIVIK